MNKINRKIRGMISQNLNDIPQSQDYNLDNFYERMFQRDIFLHISEVSVAMLGVCLTGVSILNVDEDINNADTYIDNLLAINAIVFLASYLLSYWVMRVMTKSDRNVRRIGNIANIVFLVGMILMGLICGGIVLQGDYLLDI
jgi:hypothetical protein